MSFRRVTARPRRKFRSFYVKKGRIPEKEGSSFIWFLCFASRASEISVPVSVLNKNTVFRRASSLRVYIFQTAVGLLRSRTHPRPEIVVLNVCPHFRHVEVMGRFKGKIRCHIPTREQQNEPILCSPFNPFPRPPQFLRAVARGRRGQRI